MDSEASSVGWLIMFIEAGAWSAVAYFVLQTTLQELHAVALGDRHAAMHWYLNTSASCCTMVKHEGCRIHPCAFQLYALSTTVAVVALT
jgi:hypothetical protein